MTVLTYLSVRNVLWRLYRNLTTILEEHFGKHRRNGGYSDNPTLETFRRQAVALGLINSDLISGMMGKTSGQPDTRPSIDVTDVQLPVKRAKKDEWRNSIGITSFYDLF